MGFPNTNVCRSGTPRVRSAGSGDCAGRPQRGQQSEHPPSSPSMPADSAELERVHTPPIAASSAQRTNADAERQGRRWRGGAAPGVFTRDRCTGRNPAERNRTALICSAVSPRLVRVCSCSWSPCARLVSYFFVFFFVCLFVSSRRGSQWSTEPPQRFLARPNSLDRPAD